MNVATLERAFADMNSGLYDFTKNGQCSQCGNCCSRLLLMSDKEIRAVHRYVKKHGIKTCKHTIPLKNDTIDMCCPFIDMDKSNEKCRIYEVRPAICKCFICNAEKRVNRDKELLSQTRKTVDMWKEFGGQDETG